MQEWKLFQLKMVYKKEVLNNPDLRGNMNLTNNRKQQHKQRELEC